MEKNANTAFSDLFCALIRADDAPSRRTVDDFQPGCTWYSAQPGNVGLREVHPASTPRPACSLACSVAAAGTAADRVCSQPAAVQQHVWQALRHEGDFHNWTSAVFLRDPLERFVSGFLSKCTDGHDPDRHICASVFGATDATFAQAVAVMEQHARNGTNLQRGIAQAHFRWQSSFCNGLGARHNCGAYVSGANPQHPQHGDTQTVHGANRQGAACLAARSASTRHPLESGCMRALYACWLRGRRARARPPRESSRPRRLRPALCALA
ncbi:sulfotransferase family protein [bacterium]|nr:sulfotransferase family protein [bacterium]